MRKLSLLTVAALALFSVATSAQASTMSYQVTEAFSDIYGQFGDGHSLWMPSGGAAIPATSSRYVFSTPPAYGIFTEYFTAGEHTHSVFTGVVENESDSGNAWEIDFYFTAIPDTQVIELKKELKVAAYSENGGPVDVSTWRYYNFDKSTLTGLNDNAGKVLTVSQMPANLKMPLQVGYGANGKNANFGMSAWYFYNGDYEGRGDINVDLTHAVPEPASMLLFGTGLVGAAIRRKFIG